MRQHELLYLLADLTDWMKREPTREELTYNWWLNRELFAGSPSDMRVNLLRLREKGAIALKRCCPTCHAQHVHMTPKGHALLAEWNAKGCGAEHKTEEECERPPRFHFEEGVRVA